MSATGGGKRSASALLLACVAVATPTPASADEPPFDPAIELQLFDYQPGPKSFMSVASGDTAGAKQFSMDFLATFMTDPFTIYNYDENTGEITTPRANVVEQLFAGQLVGAYGLTDDLQLGASLPLVFSMSGEGVDPNTGTMSADGLQATGLGDLRLEVKGRLVRSEALSAAWYGGLTAPTSFGSEGGDFLGDDLPTLRGGGAVQWRDSSGKLTAGANMGVILRKPREVYASTIGQQLTYGVAGAFNATERFSVIGEIFGRTGLTALDIDGSPLEVGGGMRLQATKSISVLAGGGAGLIRGIGAPGLRALVSVGYAPDFRDSDGDGIANQDDQCPLVAEDLDEFEDQDGCPDDDNDGDKREDAIDECPMEPEDLDGFEDEDGCPELDNDKDGIVDTDDRCPNDAEDKIKPYDTDGCPANLRDSDDDGISDDVDQCPNDYEDLDEFEDWDGCPDADNDNDGIVDESDLCPLCPEDADGYKDDDGCPDLDNDRDGISDREDQCPSEAEVINGTDDDDGCPDSGSAIAELDGNRLIVSEEIRFNRRDVLRSRRVVDGVAKIMKAHPEVTRWRVVVAARRQRTDEATRAKSQAQADVLRDRLLAQGVDASRIEAIGAVSDNPIVAIAVIERGDVEAPEVMCPAELQVEGRPEPATPSTSASSAAPAAVGDSAPAAADPVEKQPAAPPEPATVPEAFDAYSGVVSGVSFRRDKPTMRRRSRRVLNKVAALMKEHPRVALEIGAHTDHRRGPEKTRVITQEQAEVVLTYLVEQGVAAERLTAVGYGMDKPIGNNSTSKGRDRNRRIEFSFSVRQPE